MFLSISPLAKKYCLDNFSNYKKCGFDYVFCTLCKSNESGKSIKSFNINVEKINKHAKDLNTKNRFLY